VAFGPTHHFQFLPLILELMKSAELLLVVSESVVDLLLSLFPRTHRYRVFGIVSRT
jgi:hypothetical protein